jgi:SAM-dependent methyltransferase
MSEEAARTWDQRYRAREGREDDPPVWGRSEPSAFLAENVALLPRGGRALDVAMGSGRNAVYLASLGFAVTGVDVSRVACDLAAEAAREAGVSIEVICADLAAWDVPAAAFDVVVNFNYLQRDLCPRIAAGLRPGGVLVFQTFTTEQRQHGWGPSTDDFLLLPGELTGLFPELETLVYRERSEESERGPKAVAGLVARRPA